MPRDVFISYSTKDQSQAELLRDGLESAGIRCWIASRDIPPGASWAGEIEQAIREAKVMVVVVSPEFNESDQTRKEIVLGVDERLAILAIRIVEFQPWSHLRYFLSDCQWIDAPGDQLQARLSLIVQAVRDNLDRSGVSFAELPRPGQSSTGRVQTARDLGIMPLGTMLKLHIPRGRKLRTGQPSQFLQAHNLFIPMVGRERELEELSAFATQEGAYRWQVYFGEGGMGKTRLAIEFCKRMLSEGWQAGFLDGGELKSFVDGGHLRLWRPCIPTFVVVDYAASKVIALRNFLEHCAHMEAEAEDDAPGAASRVQVRMLLLERHADESRGWLKELLASGEGVAGDFLRNVCYAGARELQPPGDSGARCQSAIDHTHRIVQETFGSWERVTGRKAPVLPEFSENDWRLVQMQTGNRPLYVQMAALHACEQGAATNLPEWGRSELLKAAVTRERVYVEHECRDPDLRKAVEHITAMLCLTGVGLSRGRAWNRILDDELKGIGVPSITPNQVERSRRAVFAESRSGSEDGEVGVIQPDIVSEGYAATVLREEEDPPRDALIQIVQLAGIKAWTNLLRMVQDLGGVAGFEHIDEWLTPLVPLRPTEELQQLVYVVPERADSLHDFGLLAGEELLKRIPESNTLERAACLLALGTHRHRRTNLTGESLEQAVKELREAIELYNHAGSAAPASGISRWLAKAHRILGFALSSLGRHSDAIVECWVAAKLIGDPKGALEDLAPDYANIRIADLLVPEQPEDMREIGNCLNGLSIELRFLNAIAKAIEVSKLAVDVGERLIAHSWRLYAPDLARYLNNLGQGEAESGNRAEALVHCRRSARIREEFARQNPDEYAHPLSLTLGNLAALEYAENNIQAALSVNDKMVQIYGELSSRSPARYRGSLAQSYHNIGYLFYHFGNKEQSMSFTQKGLEIREELVAADFDRYALDLAWSHHNVSIDYDNLGDLEKAREHAERAYTLRMKWADSYPDRRVGEIFQNADFLARNFRKAGDREGEKLWLTRLVDALDRHLSELDPEQGDNYHSAAAALGRHGDYARGIDCARKCATCVRKAIAADESGGGGPNIVNLRCTLSSALAMQGDWENNVEALDEGIEVVRAAFESIGPAKSDGMFIWGALKHNLGHCLFRKGELAGSLDLIQKGLAALAEAADFQRANKFDGAAAETEELMQRVRVVIRKLESENLDATPLAKRQTESE